MPSWQSYLLRIVLQHRHLLHLRLKKETINFDTSILRLREEANRTSSKLGKMPEGIEVSPITIDNLYAEWILPSRGQKDKVILYIHGGGYVMGSCQGHRALVAKFVKKTGVGAMVFDYRLAPEHPFPAAVKDSVSAYNWLLNQGVAPSNIIIVGDSAGGGLCLATLLALRDQGIPLPAGAVALSPWTDLKCTGESYNTKAKHCLSPEGSWTVFSDYYVGENDPTNPWISPLYGDLHGLPPIRLYVAEDEILRDDSIGFAQKAKEAGVEIKLRVEKGMVHCYPLLEPLIPEATKAMNEICEFIKYQLGK